MERIASISSVLGRSLLEKAGDLCVSWTPTWVLQRLVGWAVDCLEDDPNLFASVRLDAEAREYFEDQLQRRKPVNLRVNGENEGFEYPRLPSHNRHIRLLSRQKAEISSQLHFALTTVSLDDKPQYNALSYVWGAGKATESIYVNGCAYMIRRNLLDFLSTIPNNAAKDQPLFVDAICINQTDLAERESQVSLMHDIYSNALKVIAWLGTLKQMSDHDARGCLQMYQRVIDSNSELASKYSSRFQSRGTNLDSILRAADGSWSLADRAAILKSSERHFWDRLWTTQEIILAQNLEMQVGHLVFTPELYLSLYADLIDHAIIKSPSISGNQILNASTFGNIFPNVPPRKTLQVYNIVLQRPIWQERLRNGPPVHMYEAMLQFYHQKSTDPRDGVFALLNLGRSNCVPDYSISPAMLLVYVLTERMRDMYDWSRPDHGTISKYITRAYGFLPPSSAAHVCSSSK